MQTTTRKTAWVLMAVGWMAVYAAPALCSELKIHVDSDGYKIQLPANWAIRNFSSKEKKLIVVPPGETAFKLMLRGLKKPDGVEATELNEFVDQVCVPEIQKTPGVEILEKWQSKINGHEARTLLYVFNEKPGGKMRYKAYVFQAGPLYYWLTYGGKDGVFEKYSGTADDIVNSFQLADNVSKPKTAA